jgi:hypothetical protein
MIFIGNAIIIFMSRFKQRVINKTGKQKCDVCNNEELLVQHHIQGRNISNPHHSSNLCNICPNCHYDIHKGIKIIEKWVNSTNGLILLWHFNGEESFTNEDSKVHLF